MYDNGSGAGHVALQGNLAYIASWNNALTIVNVANPANPTFVGSLALTGYMQGLTVSGNLAYVTIWMDGMRIINVANPAAPTQVGTFDTPGDAMNVALWGTIAIVAVWAWLFPELRRAEAIIVWLRWLAMASWPFILAAAPQTVAS
jgi:hypothetical protein